MHGNVHICAAKIFCAREKALCSRKGPGFPAEASPTRGGEVCGFAAPEAKGDILF